MNCLRIFLILYTCTLQALSLEEKVGQLLMVHFTGEVVNEEARVLIQDVKVGGIIYYNWANGLDSPVQIKTLSEELQKLALGNPTPIPLFIAVDQEGGAVCRLKQGFTQFPGNREVALTKNPQLAKEIAFAMGREMADVGINMNLAPVVDVHTNPENPFLRERCFGHTPDVVISFGQNALDGYRKAGILSTLKHFPGHGAVEVDSHYDLPVVRKSLKDLEEWELSPFASLHGSADAIMTAHLLVPALDADNCATLSKNTLTYLRDVIGFQGVIITDSLVMDGVLKACGSVDEAAIRALIAGCDVLLLGGKLLNANHSTQELKGNDIIRIHRAIVEAVKEGRIPEERVEQAVERILKAKRNALLEPLFAAEIENHERCNHRHGSQQHVVPIFGMELRNIVEIHSVERC